MTATRISPWIPVVLWAAVIFTLSSVPDLGTGLGTWDLVLRKIAHTTEYALLGALIADAGASGFFVPRLADPRQVERIVKEVPLPLNLIAFPGAPSKKEWANAGAARISHGPFPHRALMAKFEEMAKAAIG